MAHVANLSERDELARYLNTLRQYMPEIQSRYQVRSLGVFGSYVRGEQGPESDLDILVEFSEAPSLFRYIEFQDYLADLLGVPVDLVMRSALRRRIGRRILEEVIAVPGRRTNGTRRAARS